MAATFAELMDTQTVNSIKILETIEQMARTVTDDYLTQEDAAIQALEGTLPAIVAVAGGIATFRAGVNASLSSAEAVLTAHVESFRKLVNKPSASFTDLFNALFDYMRDNSEDVNGRNFTRGAFSAAGGNTGDGTINRLTTDADNFPIENTFAEVITTTIVRNASGAIPEVGGGKTDKGREAFLFEGQAAGDDQLDREETNRGSGGRSFIANKTADDSLIQNGTFHLYSGTGASITAITGWTVTNAIGNFEEDTTNTYRASPVEGDSPGALKITATDTITQTFSVQNASITAAPKYIQIAWNRTVGSSTGTLELHMGSASASVVAAAQSGWQILRVAIGQNSWPENFEEQDATDIKVVWTETGGTGLLVDDLVFVDFDSFENLWYSPVGGATFWALNDSGTMTDTEAGAVVQRWFWRGIDEYLPSVNDGSETVTDPSVTF